MSTPTKRIVLVTDAWSPQVNGVVTTLTQLTKQLLDMDYMVGIVEPSQFKCYRFPLYKEVLMPWNMVKVYRTVATQIKFAQYVHIATEGPIGLMARLYCHRHNIPYITSYHTRFPEYANARWSFLKLSWGYAVMRWMHNRASSVLVTTKSMQEELTEWGINNTVVWNRGVDTGVFRPVQHLQNGSRSLDYPDLPNLGYVGRVSVEKNMEAFLDLPDYLGKKIVVGDGPDRKRLEKKYPNVRFVGYKFGKNLVAEYNKMDIMVFPSKTDTFGLVNLEAMACGTPVAAFPVTGPKDIIQEGVTGSMNDDLAVAVKNALLIDRNQCMLATRNNHSWDNALLPYLGAIVDKEGTS
jgi:glycosyltransferase involved in cell wall biosynthesis